MITTRTNHNNILKIHPLNINTFINKPFQIPKILNYLRNLLPKNNEPHIATANDENFLHHLTTLSNKEIDLPLHNELFQQLHDTTATPNTLEQLGEH